jgi:hypothetical protein
MFSRFFSKAINSACFSLNLAFNSFDSATDSFYVLGEVLGAGTRSFVTDPYSLKTASKETLFIFTNDWRQFM